MRNIPFKSLLACIAAMVLLAACGGGGDGGGSPGGGGTTASEVPQSALQSSEGLVVYLLQLMGTLTNNTSEPVVLGDITLPTSETSEPLALR